MDKCVDRWTYKWTNVTCISHLPINLCVKYVFNARYQFMKCTNCEWTNFVWFPLLSHEMLSLWCKVMSKESHFTCVKEESKLQKSSNFKIDAFDHLIICKGKEQMNHMFIYH
jgi:hypothetical protein